MAENFRAMIVRETEQGYVREIRHRSVDELPAGDVLIRVLYSSLNYKDALSAAGNKGVTRQYPHTPGVDAAGIVAQSSSSQFQIGDEVIVTGYDLGMNTDGGFGQYIRVPAHWPIKRPETISLKESMMFGTAGFAAALSVYRLQAIGVRPEHGEILVTGATGGVGSIAVGLLASGGYQVAAVSGKADQKQFLTDLGAARIISRDEALDTSNRALLKEQWAGAIDTVGGQILASAIRATRYGGAVTCCGNAASPDLSLTVYPFIIRGVSLLGVDSVQCPTDTRLRIWQRLATEWKLDQLDRLAVEISLDQLDANIDRILQGKIRGRIVVNLYP